MELFRVVIHATHQLTHHHGGEQQTLAAEGFTGLVVQQALLNDNGIHRFALAGKQFHNTLTRFDGTEIHG
ncbi:MAG: Uncharacterised protein [Synechococcus sp. MIT S9220]|nr:MAG: Uncharacterised protein [Synechococcus sp. MIT S9220]